MQLKDKTAIITGGGSGFGASMAELFAKNGAKVIVADINLDNANKVAAQMGGFPVQVDVGNADSVEQMKIAVFKKSSSSFSCYWLGSFRWQLDRNYCKSTICIGRLSRYRRISKSSKIYSNM